jgi:DNA-binding CsgD family transcriptional regulator
MSTLAADYEAAVDAVYRAAASPDAWPDTLALLADHVGATGGMVVYNAPAGQPSFMVSGRLRSDLDDIYLKHYTRNPITVAAARMPPGQVHVASQLVDMARVRRSAFYADILAPQGIAEQVVVPLASLTQRGGVGGIGFALSKKHTDETERTVTRLGRLVAHLSRAVDFTLQIGRHQSGLWQIEHILDAIPGAALLVDRTGSIMRANAKADTLLTEADGLCATKADGLHLTAQVPWEARTLASHVNQALAVARGEEQSLNGSLQITRPSGRPPLMVLITPLPPLTFSLWETVDGGARAMVQIVDLHAPTSAQAETLRVAAGLTAAEARVAALIGGGMNTSEAAATLGVSINTVKTQLTRCFDKTGVRSQVALARLLASIPVPAPPAAKSIQSPSAK